MANAFLIQTEPNSKSKEASFEHVRKLVRRTNPEHGSLLLLPEMFATGFLTNPEKNLAENLASSEPTFRFLRELSDETGCTVLGGGIEHFPQKKFQFRNWTAAFAPGNTLPLTVYRKRHPFMAEAEQFSPGTEMALFDWNGFTISPTICFDLRFPEDFRRARAAGASLLTVQAEWPQKRDLHFKTLLRARAIENQCYVLGCGRAGDDFANSCAFGPNGEELLHAPPNENMYKVTVDINAVKSAREAFPLPMYKD